MLETIIFKQKRLGKDKKPFIMYKFRTMVKDAEKLKAQYNHLNEASGPAFKIHDDPRYTKIGKFLAHTGLDELPQLINVIKGDMALVGPRPLPVEEAKKVPKKYEKRFSVLPGITSSWVVAGSHKLSFDQWMKLDLEYIRKKSPFFDFKTALLTIVLMAGWLKSIFFSLLILAIFIFEGLALGNGRQIGYSLILLLPTLLFLPDIIIGKKLACPKKIGLTLFLFLLFSTVSIFFSVNAQRSFEQLLFYIGAFLFFIYVFNNKDALIKPTIGLIFFLSFFFAIYSILIPFFLQKGWFFLFPASAYNLVYPSSQTHNHLGDFLVVPISIAFYFFVKGKRQTLSALATLFFTALLVFSYSRSAYLALLISLVAIVGYLKLKGQIKNIVLPTIFIIVLTIFLSAFSIAILSDVKEPIQGFRNILVYNFGLRQKDLIANHDQYIKQALFSMKDNLLFGVGPNNFIYASKRYQVVPDTWSEVSHNIFLSMFSENGVLAGLIFLLVIWQIITSPKKNYFFFAFLGLLINFQTDYTYIFYSLLLLFFILAALTYEEKETFEIHSSRLFTVVLILLLITSLMVLSNIFYSFHAYRLAFITYPLNQKVYPALIEEKFKTGDYKTALARLQILLPVYKRLYSADTSVLSYVGDKYLFYGQKKEALNVYNQAYLWNPYNMETFMKLYSFKQLQEGETAARILANSFFKQLEVAKKQNQNYSRMYLQAQEFCQKIYTKCPYDL